jgi:hypothetical protein
VVEEAIKPSYLGADVLREGRRIEQLAEPQEADQPIGRRRVVEPGEREVGHEMNVPRLRRLDLAPYRVGADRGIKAPVDGQDHIGLPGKDLLGGDLDDRARGGVHGDNVARADKVDDFAADRAGDRRLEATRSACEIDARTLFRRDLCDGLLNSPYNGLGVTRERLGAPRDTEQVADRP